MSSPDAVKTGGALSNLGYFGANGESEFSLPNSVKAFQYANGLKVDGIINKGGPTEKAFGVFMEKVESYVKKTGAFKSIGVEIKGLKANFKISKAGLMSAAHRQGQVNVAKYLEFQKANGWKSDFSKLSPRQQGEFKSIETALRTYEHIPYDD